MTIWNLGSINVDHVYRVPRLPAPGETLAAQDYAMGLGGKGANQSVAAARAGADVHHIGAVGTEGVWAREALAGFGVGVAHVGVADIASGHAIIYVDPQAENVIVTYAGANHAATADSVALALADAASGDTLLLQNETTAQPAAARLARDRGLRVIYSAAPFQIAAVRAVLSDATLLVMNAGEAAELRESFGTLPAVDCIVTLGSRGAEWISPGAEPLFVPAIAVTAIDTTGAGDCFAGTLAAALDAGLPRDGAMRRAVAAAAIQVTRAGAAQAMPTAAEVDALLTA